jgi:hypothetical protein
MNEPNEKLKLKTVGQIYEATLKLSAEERALLAAKLKQDVTSGFSSPEIQTAWLDEVRRRRTLHAQGKTRDVPGEEVFAMLQQKVEDAHTTSPELKQAWVAESDRRMQLIEEGEAGWVDGEQVLQDLRKSICS